MSHMGRAVHDMEMDAYWMGLKEFIDKWGISSARVWSDVRTLADLRYEQNRAHKEAQNGSK